jgi:hypothetical protein
MTASLPDTVFCPVCNYGYVRGLPGEARLHAAFHARYMRPRKPKPEPRLAAYGGDVRVDYRSPVWLHRRVYQCALGLKRDEHYDFPQWGERDAPENSRHERNHHAWLLVEDLTPVGAVGFLDANWADIGWHPTMFFAWVADAWRRKGVMSRR